MKTLIISGGTSGIGRACVDLFCRSGYFVFILDNKEPEEKIAHTQWIACDIANFDEIQRSVNKIVEQNVIIDALVCNAGVHYSATILDTSVHAYEKVLDINFRGAFFLTQMVLPHMLAQKKGAIVYVGSDQTLIAKPHSAIYAASKAALGSLAKTTAIDYAKFGIRANLVATGTTDTPLYQQAITRYCERTGADPSLIHKHEANEQPIGRIAQPHEIANLIYFLCCDAASFITGGIYPIDGGYTAR
jgi:2-keto-3-deoxy-L-fuconate dehydrogenase